MDNSSIMNLIDAGAKFLVLPFLGWNAIRTGITYVNSGGNPRNKDQAFQGGVALVIGGAICLLWRPITDFIIATIH